MTPLNRSLFTSACEEWGTPGPLFAALDTEFAFSLDPCASPANAKVATYFTRQDDGLTVPWAGTVFVNPPYGRQVGRWLAKAYAESRCGAVVVCLIAARTDTVHWHRCVMRASEVRFICGRLCFESPGERALAPGTRTTNSAPFPSCIVIFRPGWQGPPVVSSIGRDGSVLYLPADAVLRQAGAHDRQERRPETP